MSMTVREAFRDQARWCDQLGSPFTARVCRLCAERLSAAIPVATRILDWPGDPSVKADSVPLRLAGALHFLARTGKAPALRAVYPPEAANDEELWAAISLALGEHEDLVRSYLATAPQTNEVMRSAALLPGLLRVAELTGLPLELYEIGASAGLNLILDRYRYQFGSATWGDAGSSLLIKPQWNGAAPAVNASLVIRSRHGVDLNPIDLRDQAARQRLLSYVWADQAERLQRLNAAMALWLSDPSPVESADAAQWLEQSSITQATPGVTRVLVHSVTWSYFPETTRQRIARLLRACGGQANQQAPLAWLRFELSTGPAELRLSLWPGDEDVLLATGHPHGTTMGWLG